MTHAAKSHDAIDRLQEMRDRLDEIIRDEKDRAELLAKEEAELHAKVAMANAIAVMSKVARQSRVSDGDRRQLQGVIEQLGRVA